MAGRRTTGSPGNPNCCENLSESGAFYGRTLRKRSIGDLVFVDSFHPASSRLPRHTHERAYFCLNHGGTYAEEYGRRRRVCQPGMLVVHPPGEAHSETHGNAPVLSFNVEVGWKWMTRLIEFAQPLDEPAEFRDDEVTAAGLRLFREFSRPIDEDSLLAMESLTWEILAASVIRKGLAADTKAPHWLTHARDLVDARLNEPPSLRSLAQEVRVHPVHFAATFRRFYGCSVGEYFRRRRLERARRMLADKQLPLSQIALDAGFADQSHFTRTFKRFTGLAPVQYRTFLAFKTH